mgnify:CR=1 FL=1
MSLSKVECGRLGGRPRLATLEVIRQHQSLETQNNEKEVMGIPGRLPDNLKELRRLYKLRHRSNGHKQIQEGTRGDLITSGPRG